MPGGSLGPRLSRNFIQDGNPGAGGTVTRRCVGDLQFISLRLVLLTSECEHLLTPLSRSGGGGVHLDSGF